MKGLSGLWRNECFKIYRQTANRVIIIIALALSLLIPVFNLLISASGDFLGEFSDSRDYWEENANYCLQEKDYVGYADWKSRIDACDFFDEIGVAEDTWKYQMFFEQYRTLKYHSYALELFIDGKFDKDLFASWFYSDFRDDADETPEPGYYADGSVIDHYEEVDPSWVDDFDAAAKLEEVKTSIADLEASLGTLTVRDFANMQLVTAKSQLSEKKSELGEIKNARSKGNVDDNEVLKAQLEVEAADYMVSFLEHMSKTDVPESESDWLVKTVTYVGAGAASSLVNVPVSEDDFYDSMNTYMYGTDDYDKYCERVEQARTTARRALMTVDYSVEHGIPLPEMTPHSAKNLTRDALSSVGTIIIIALIIVTANNIALEYSSGTIRLLLIRPRRRSKIILSKFLALLTTGLIVSVAAFVIVTVVSAILSGAVYGVWDIFTPDLICFSGVVRISSMLYSLAKLFLPLLSGLFLLSIAFMMAVVTRRAALAIIAPIIINSLASIGQLAAMYYASDFPVLKYTILPYLNLGPYLISPVSQFARTDIGILNIADEMYRELVLASNISALTGTVVVLIHAVILYALGFWVFNKQQIKN